MSSSALSPLPSSSISSPSSSSALSPSPSPPPPASPPLAPSSSPLLLVALSQPPQLPSPSLSLPSPAPSNTVAGGASAPSTAAVTAPQPPPLPPTPPPPISGAAAGGVAAASSLSSALSSLCAEWRVFGLDGRRVEIDGRALSMAESEERAAAARRSLSELSKALKRAGAEERLLQVGGVVKAYQLEINALTRRTKQAETAYLTLYHALMQVSDPTDALQAAAQSLQSQAALEAALRSARQRLSEYESEFSTLKNQDASLRRVEAELREAERRSDGRVQQALLQREEQHRLDVQRLHSEQAERESALQSALSEAHEQLRAQQRAAELQEERHFALSEKADTQLREAEREVESMRAEHERMTADLLALRNRLDAVEREGGQGGAGGRGSVADGVGGVGDAYALSSLEDALFAAREALARFEAERDDALEQHRRERHAATLSVAQLQGTVDAQSALIAQLQQQQHAQPTHGHRSAGGDRKEAALAPRHASLQLAGADEEDEEGAVKDGLNLTTVLSSSSSPAPPVPSQAALDELQATVARLHAELERARQATAAREAEWTAAEQEVRNALAQQQSNVAQLELDVQSLQQQLLITSSTRSRSPHSTTAAAAAAAASLVPASSIPPGTLSSPGSHTAGESAAASTVLSGSTSSDSTLLSIVTGQRDRLRARVEVAEKAASDASLALQEVQQRCQQLHQDNLELYEKLQFVQDKTWKQPSSAHGNAHGQQLSLDVRGSGGGAASSSSSSTSSSSERRYASLYAESVNPFTAFKARALRESERSLPPSERVALSVARLVFSRKAARSFAFFYALLLHLLIFGVLWFHTVADHCSHHHGE